MVIVDYLVSYAPPFNASVPIATPLNLVLDWPMCMPSGYAAFRDPAFNAQLRRVLDAWCAFLSGPHSRTHLTSDEPHGWFSEGARKRWRLRNSFASLQRRIEVSNRGMHFSRADCVRGCVPSPRRKTRP
nr:phophatidylserine decarboxylase associated domain-containing protein [Paraburkholderia unamae]